jgi:pantothenate kinase
VGMDGWHLANSVLDRLGRRDRKGAPDTFDAPGYVAFLERVRSRRPRRSSTEFARCQPSIPTTATSGPASDAARVDLPAPTAATPPTRA